MSNDLIVGIKLTADGTALVGPVKLAREEVDKLSQSTQAINSSAEKYNATLQGQARWFNETTASVRQQSEAAVAASVNVGKLLDRYDPLSVKLRQLQADFNALNSAAKSGIVGAQDDSRLDTAYAKIKQELSLAQGAAAGFGGAAASGFGQAEAGAVKSAFATAQARRELIVLGHEGLTGNFSRMPGSFMVLAERISLSQGALTSIMLPIAAVGGAAFAMFKAISDGHKEMEEMNNALAVTSNYAGMTRGSMRELAAGMAAAGTVTIGTSKEIVTALVASGRIGSESIGAVARLTSDYAKATGQDIAKIAPQMVKLFEDPAKGAETLNQSMHFLNTTDMEHIQHLVRIGELGEAQLFLSEKMTGHIPKQTENLGLLEKGWNAVKSTASGAWDAMLGIGREDTLEEKLKKLTSEIAAAAKGGNNLRAIALANEYAGLKSAVTDAAAKAKSDSESAAANERSALAQKEVDKSVTHQITMLGDQLTLLKSAPDSADKERRKYEINKQIADAYRSIGAESRQMNQAEIEGQLKLREIAISMDSESNDARLKLGQITQAEHDKTKLALELQKNAVEQITNLQLQAIPALTAAEKQKLAITLDRLKAEQAAIELKGGNEALVNEKKYYDEIRKAVDAASAAEIGSLDKTIAAQQLHNAEIGKTAEQKELEKAAIENVTISRLEDESAALRAAANEVDMSQQFKDIYTARANALDSEIAKRKELAGLQVTAAEKEKAAAVAEEWKKDAKEINKSLTDALMRGFESGKGYAQNLRDTMVNMFKTTVLRPIISAVMQPVSGAIASGMGSLGFSGAANAAQAGSGMGGGFGGFGGFSSMATDWGSFGLGVGSGAESLGFSTEAAQSIGGAADVGGQALGYANALFAARDGQWGKALGSAVGTYFGGPIGSIIGSTVGSWVDSAFGGGGGAKIGASGSYQMANGQLVNSSPGGNSGGDPLHIDTLVTQSFAKLDAVAAQLGASVSNTRLRLGYDFDPSGSAPGWINYGAGGVDARYQVSGQDVQGGAKSLQDAANRAVMLALQSSSLPDYLASAIKSVNAQTATSEQIDAAVSYATALKQVHDQLSETRTPLEIAKANIASMGTTVASYSADFKHAIEASMTAETLAKWQALGPAVQAVADAAAQAAKQLSDQRRSMEINLMQLTGQTSAALDAQRADALAAMDASLRPLQEQINAQTDLTTAYDKANAAVQAMKLLTTDSFATLIDYTRYMTLAANAGVPGADANLAPAPANTFMPGNTSNNDANKVLVDSVNQLRAEMQSGQIALATYMAETAKILRRWNGDGMPEVRVLV